jgi:HEAT repeat protein
LLKLADHPSEFVRWWAVQLLAEDRRPSAAALDKFAAMAASDPSSFVRLSVASALQRIEPKSRWPIIEKLTQHEEDSSDKDLPLMIWYAVEPLVSAEPKRAIQLAGRSKIKLVREYISRRIASR